MVRYKTVAQVGLATPLHFAALGNQEITFKTLIERGADVSSLDKKNRSVFEYALATNHVIVAVKKAYGSPHHIFGHTSNKFAPQTIFSFKELISPKVRRIKSNVPNMVSVIKELQGDLAKLLPVRQRKSVIPAALSDAIEQHHADIFTLLYETNIFQKFCHIDTHMDTALEHGNGPIVAFLLGKGAKFPQNGVSKLQVHLQNKGSGLKFVSVINALKQQKHKVDAIDINLILENIIKENFTNTPCHVHGEECFFSYLIKNLCSAIPAFVDYRRTIYGEEYNFDINRYFSSNMNLLHHFLAHECLGGNSDSLTKWIKQEPKNFAFFNKHGVDYMSPISGDTKKLPIDLPDTLKNEGYVQLRQHRVTLILNSMRDQGSLPVLLEERPSLLFELASRYFIHAIKTLLLIIQEDKLTSAVQIHDADCNGSYLGHYLARICRDRLDLRYYLNNKFDYYDSSNEDNIEDAAAYKEMVKLYLQFSPNLMREDAHGNLICLYDP